MSATDFDMALQNNQQERSISAKSDRWVSGFAVRASAKSDVCPWLQESNNTEPQVLPQARCCGSIQSSMRCHYVPRVTLCFLALLILDLVLLMGWKDFQLMPWIRQVPGPFCGLSFCCLCRFLSHATGTKTCRSKPSPSCRAALKEKSRHEKVPHLKVVGKRSVATWYLWMCTEIIDWNF